jgi:maltooligosyltrehalose trehalohydrolase
MGMPTTISIFCDFKGELADKVNEGRRREFARFPQVRDPSLREKIPDPSAKGSFRTAVLDWRQLQQASHCNWFAFHRRLLAVRHERIVSRLQGMRVPQADSRLYPPSALRVDWHLSDVARLHILANLDKNVLQGIDQPDGDVVFLSEDIQLSQLAWSLLPPWSVACFLEQ